MRVNGQATQASETGLVVASTLMIGQEKNEVVDEPTGWQLEVPDTVLVVLIESLEQTK